MMLDNLLIIGMFLYITIILLTGEKLYCLGLDFFATKKLKKLGYSFNDLEFSFEQIYYIVSTPSINSELCKLPTNNYFIKKGKLSLFSSKINDLQIFVKMPNGKKKLLAIVPKDRFPVPILDSMLYYNEIDQKEYDLLIAYLFSHVKTHDMIIKEVNHKIIEG